jgi:hypothetical protein
MTVYLEQAKILLDLTTEVPVEIVETIKKDLDDLHKNSGIVDMISDPRLSNAINLLTPFVVNYKVNQVLKLLKELGKEQVRIDPNTGLRKFI